MIVLDASAVLELLLETPRAGAVQRLVTRSEMAMHAPHLLDVEVLHVVRRFWLAGSLDEARAEGAIRDFLALRIERHSHEVLASRIWELRSCLCAYDAAYVALAELLEVPLITTDARLARSAAARRVAELIQ